jgi:hypothetical protein
MDVGIKLGITASWKTPVNLFFPNKMNTSSFSVVIFYRNFYVITSRNIKTPSITATFPNMKYNRTARLTMYSSVITCKVA